MPAAKTTSARGTLALVVAALALGGCGGGSSEESSTATTSASSAPAANSAASGSPAPGSGSKASPGQKQGSGAPGQGGEGKGAAGAGAQGQKQGPRIAAPTGPTEQAPSAEEIEEATLADMTLQSPAIAAQAGSLGRLAPTYTCDGKDSWPAFSWGGVPPGTAELALFAMNLQPVDEVIFFDWALSGIDPSVTSIEAGKLPKGAVVGQNSFGKSGYSLCPPGPGETYMFALYALPQRLGLKRGFDAAAARKAVLDLSGNAGLLPAVYERG